MRLRDLILCGAATLLLSPSALAQTFAERAVDPNEPPPALSNPNGPATWVDDGLNYASLVGTASTHTDGEASPDTLGAFRFLCYPSWLLTDDPLVSPGQPGKSHAHQGYGNDAVTAATTYASLRVTGHSSCASDANRSGYWMEALIGPDGRVIRPNVVTIYYKREPAGSAYCTPGNVLYVGRCVTIPTSLRMIFGYDMVTGTTPSGHYAWKCVYNSGGANGEFDNIPAALASCAGLPGGLADLSTKQLALGLSAQGCWDGVNLDSSNHRSHVADEIQDVGGTARIACPRTHPYHIPFFTATAFWSLDSSMDFSGEWHAGKTGQTYLSGDQMPGMPQKKPGTTAHMDYFEGWNLTARTAWTANCIDRWLNCNSGDLGNGKILLINSLYADQPAVATPRLVKRPKMRQEHSTITIHGPM